MRGIADSLVEIASHRITWAPDGDEAFDDGSYVLQFDVGDKVRLVAFKSGDLGHQYDPETLNDRWLEADQFYSILQQWRDAFEAEWRGMPRVPESEDGAEG